jgi:hypothetical protein
MTPPDHTLEESAVINRIHAARESFELRRANRAERAKLERELAGYTSPRDRLELEAILERYPLEDTRDLWAILASQRI